MSQYYPQPGPFYPPEQGPEDDYYEDADYEYEYDDDEFDGSGNPLQRILIFGGAGGCLLVLCIVCCVLLGVGLWVLDPGAGLVATDVPGSDIGLSFDEPAFSDETVVNEQMVRLAILEVNRNASLPSIPPVEGREIIVVTIELVNLGGEDIGFNERDFTLLNQVEEAYAATPGVIDGALGRGILPPDTGLEGRLVFEVVEGEFELIMAWEPGSNVEARYIYLE
ncbi:MAG TPA: DUF4352 domain-containing protein [Anaerolineae bacterium]